MKYPTRIGKPNTAHLYAVSAMRRPHSLAEGLEASYERIKFEVEANNRNQAASMVQRYGEGFIVCDVNMIG